MDDTDTQPKQPRAVFKYNVAWMDRVFRSRYQIEDLLLPEKEAGNITTRDYDASLDFFPNNRRYYPILCSLGIASLTLLRPISTKWTRRRQGLSAFSAGFFGYTVGKFLCLNAHYNFVRSLENPGGFDRAMENIKGKLDSYVPDGPIIQRIYEPSPTDNVYGAQVPQHESGLMLPTAPDSPSSPQAPIPKPISRWDQIRNANSRSATASSWDALRQKHEKQTVKSPDANEEVRWNETA
ncbi:hypothetical protein JR316_0000912 [Psilocybe cubensis]|uniref:Uncharacterized protein n=2 Tax=Psilocybe cubensis TaxID=181762 RepID=A0ACB8HGQ0_PSICU|nr:hypothetical protein JR316_0000912 [Psilocybe cubensis]KAH9486847.1 hypothetical protein JR316_0000912 [Psilocybe cubensis]